MNASKGKKGPPGHESSKPTASQVAALFGCTEAQVERQYAANRRQLRGMAAEAAASGRPLNGYSAARLHVMAAGHEPRRVQ
jgi:hypothetical protein